MSMGYPVSSPSILTREWQEAMVWTRRLSDARVRGSATLSWNCPSLVSHTPARSRSPSVSVPVYTVQMIMLCRQHKIMIVSFE